MFPGVFSVVWSCRDRAPGDSGPKNIEKNIWTKKCFIRSEKAVGPARTGNKKIEKNRKIWLDELPARPDRTGPARNTEFPFHGWYREVCISFAMFVQLRARCGDVNHKSQVIVQNSKSIMPIS